GASVTLTAFARSRNFSSTTSRAPRKNPSSASPSASRWRCRTARAVSSSGTPSVRNGSAAARLSGPRRTINSKPRRVHERQLRHRHDRGGRRRLRTKGHPDRIIEDGAGGDEGPDRQDREQVVQLIDDRAAAVPATEGSGMAKKKKAKGSPFGEASRVELLEHH